MTNANNNLRQLYFTAMPVGAACNLSCSYCYYLDKRQILPNNGLMSDQVLHAYLEQALLINNKTKTCDFNWGGGEPLLAGKDFFRRAIKLQAELGQGRRIRNTIQTNATLIDDEWCELFSANDVIVSVSVDGPEAIHNAYRKGPLGEGSFAEVMKAIELLRKYNIQYKTLTTINAINETTPLEVYETVSSVSDYMQFVPVMERHCTIREIEELGLLFAQPPLENTNDFNRRILPFSATPEGYGNFLITVFEHWRKKDIGKKYIGLFEITFHNLIGRPLGCCMHSSSCGNFLSIEPNGDVYPCDRYAYKGCKLGNILQTPLIELAQQGREFGLTKLRSLSSQCLNCQQLLLCYGGCPKDRVTLINNNESPQNYFCPSYKRFFAHLQQYVKKEQRSNK